VYRQSAVCLCCEVEFVERRIWRSGSAGDVLHSGSCRDTGDLAANCNVWIEEVRLRFRFLG